MMNKILNYLKGLFKKKESSPTMKLPEGVEVKLPTSQKPQVDFEELVKTIKIDSDRIQELDKLKALLQSNKAKYEKVSLNCKNFPVDLMFALHYRESSNSFLGVLHNGERIIGTGQKTRLVPKLRGPFNSWEDAAIDALLMKERLFPAKWTLAAKLEFAEKFNGLGYRRTGELSPYVFAGTNLSDETGKYVGDGKFDQDAKEKQLGVAAILLHV